MNEAKQKKKWFKRWWVWVIAGFLLLYILVKANNSISPIACILGLLLSVFSGTYLWKLLHEADIEVRKQNKKRVKYTIIALAIGVILSLTGYFTLSLSKSEKAEIEVEISDIVFEGVDENTTPLAATDLKLLKKGNIYTVIGTLKKNSIDPDESYFDFSVILIDENDKHIKITNASTMPEAFGGHDNRTLFTNGSTYHFELEIYTVSTDKIPVLPPPLAPP